MEFNELWGKIGDFGVKAAKTVSGVQAYQDRKEAKLLKEEANEIYQKTLEENENRRSIANDALTAFGKLRLESLQDTVGVFLKYLTIMKYQFRDKEYDLAGNIDLKSEEVKQLESIELSAKEAFKTLFSQAQAGDFIQMKRGHGGAHSAIFVDMLGIPYAILSRIVIGKPSL